VRLTLIRDLRESAAHAGIAMFACAADDAVLPTVLPAARCIDSELVASISGRPYPALKDRNQRPACGCAPSIDIGAYNSCPHFCRYCYANSDHPRVQRNFLAHRPDSPLLYGDLLPEDRVTVRALAPEIGHQGSLF
jgi:hypothetical protein